MNGRLFISSSLCVNNIITGIRDPAQKMGINFTSGKFDLNNTSLPLSAFVDAMASLTSIIFDRDKGNKIQRDIDQSFAEDDALLLVRALPGCEKLFNLKDEAGQHDDKSLVGKEAISRLQYAIRRLLKIICTHLNGLVLFIDDLQVSDDTCSASLFCVLTPSHFIPYVSKVE